MTGKAKQLNIGLCFEDVVAQIQQGLERYLRVHRIKLGEADKIRIMKGLDAQTNEGKKFFKKHWAKFSGELNVVPGVVMITNKLLKDGHTVTILTPRDLNEVEAQISGVIVRNGVAYDTLIANVKDKTKVCKERGIDVYVDGSLEVCESIVGAGIKAILLSLEDEGKAVDESILLAESLFDVDEHIARLAIV